MTTLRVLSLSLLVGLMTLTGLGAAMARGQMASDGVICGTGTFEVILAADGLPLFDGGGDPVEMSDLPCLDCVFGQMALAPPVTTAGVMPVASSDLTPVSPATLSARLWRMGGMGRSPPRAA